MVNRLTNLSEVNRPQTCNTISTIICGALKQVFLMVRDGRAARIEAPAPAIKENMEP